MKRRTIRERIAAARMISTLVSRPASDSGQLKLWADGLKHNMEIIRIIVGHYSKRVELVRWAAKIIPWCILFENLDWFISMYLFSNVKTAYFCQKSLHIALFCNYHHIILQEKEGYFSSNLKTETLNVQILVEYENQRTI